MSRFVYLDNNATTVVAPEIQKMILKELAEYGNPSSLHFYGITASEKVANARRRIAQVLGVQPEEIIFTASGSEGNALCIRGFAEANSSKGRHIITTVIEHPSVIQSCKHLEEQGFEVTYLGVDNEGFVSPEELDKNIRPDTILVSIMHANNEIGTVQDIVSIAAICNRHKLALHTDAVQGFLKESLDLKTHNIALATYAGHKVHAPKGIGFVFKRRDIKLRRVIDGGNQEFNMRAGTENVPYIIGLARAVESISNIDVQRMKDIQKYAIEEIKKFPRVRINGSTDLSRRICSNLNISFENIEAEKLLNKLSDRGICVSTGSACSSKSTKTSPVLLAIQCPTEYIHGNIRISFSKYTKKEDINYFLKNLKEILHSFEGNVINK